MNSLGSERSDDVVIWTLQRPAAMNALDRPTLGALRQAAEAARHDRGLRGAIVTGAGDKAFSAGADLKERRGMSMDEVRQYLALIRDTMNAIARLPFPTIAAVNGVAFGGGFELMLACDLRVLSSTAQVGMTEVRVGIMPGAGGTQRLPRLVGVARAKDLIFSARRVDAAEALQMGLADRVVPAAAVLPTARALAQEIAANAPLAVRAAKHAIDVGCDAGLDAGLEIEAAAYDLLLPTRDRLEGLQAFADKRPPRYRGE